jgi:diketogulonate reductase-like aldo/keto reductase
VAQVALHWLIQRGIIVIPKSVHKERMMQNLDITNFSLSDEDMRTISALDLGHGVVVNFEDPQTRMNLQELVKKYSV